MAAPSTLRYWADLIKRRRGHAGDFATVNTPGVTEIVEQGIAEDFAEALAHTEGRTLTDVVSNPDDPPDCFATVNDRRIGIELVELVDGQALANAKKGFSSFLNCGQFRETQWDHDRFKDKLNDVIDRKHKKYAARNQVFDCLLVYTGEPWLLSRNVEAWLDTTTFDPRASFRCVYLLMSYEPGYSQQHSPLFNIYGSLA